MMIMDRKAAEFWWNIPLKGVEREKFIAPPEVSHYEKMGYEKKWQPVTWADIHMKRNEKIDWQTEAKRRPEFVIKPCFIWVFKNIHHFPFGGWWVYLKTVNEDYDISFKRYYDRSVIRRVMELFPCGVIPINENFEAWCIEFEKQYHKPCFHRTKYNAITTAWLRITKGGLLDIDTDINHLK